MKAMTGLILAAALLTTASAFAKTCTAQSVSDGTKLLSITLQPHEALIRVMNPTGQFPRVYDFGFSETHSTGNMIYYSGENFSMVYNTEGQYYEIEAVLNQSPELMPGKTVHFSHVTCQ